MSFKWLNPSCDQHKQGGGGVKTYRSLRAQQLVVRKYNHSVTLGRARSDWCL